MIMANTEQTTKDQEELLEELNNDNINEYAPVLVYVAIVIVLGIVGNVMTVIFYKFKTRKSTNTVFIYSLAAIDLITCVIISDEIIELCFSVTFKNVTGCRMMYFINHWFVVSSVLVLWIICIDRYRKVCRHSAWQFNMTSVKISIVSVFVFSLLLSIPNWVMLDVVRVNITDRNGNLLQGYYCTHSNAEDKQTIITFFHLVDVLLFVVIIFTFIILYSIIGRIIYVSRKKATTIETIGTVQHRHVFVKVAADQNTSDSGIEDIKTAEPNKTETTSSVDKHKPSNDHHHHHPSKHIHAEYRITLMMFVISSGFVLSFIPYFVVNLLVKPGKDSSKEFSAGIQLALRSFILNSAINPYIIGVFNPVFRRFVKHSFCKCFTSEKVSEPTPMASTTMTST